MNPHKIKWLFSTKPMAWNSGFGAENLQESWTFSLGFGPEWARLNLAAAGFPSGSSDENWMVDFAVS